MLEVSTIIITVLKTALKDIGINLRPIMSGEEDEKPLVNYAITELAGVTKDGAMPYRIAFRIWADSYDETLTIVDKIFTTIKESEVNGFQYNGTQEPQPDVDGELYTETNYSFQK